MALPGVQTTKEEWHIGREYGREKGKYLRVITANAAFQVLKREQTKGTFPKDKSQYTTWVDKDPRKKEVQVKFGGRITYITKQLLGPVYEWIFLELERRSPYGNKKKIGKAAFRRRHYDASHIMLINGRGYVDINAAKAAIISPANNKYTKDSKVTFVNIQPYARRIESGNRGYKRDKASGRWVNRRTKKVSLGTGARPYNWSMQAPNGVYRSVAAAAKRKFAGVARIKFGMVQLNSLGYQFKHEGKNIDQFYPFIAVTPDRAGIASRVNNE